MVIRSSKKLYVHTSKHILPVKAVFTVRIGDNFPIPAMLMAATLTVYSVLGINEFTVYVVVETSISL